MIEICDSLNLLENFTKPPQQTCKSFHLAEGPGGFIEALAYLRKNPNDTYYGMTLIDDTNQNVPGWRKSKHFLSNNPNVIIEKGIEGNGDLTKAENLKYCYDTYHGQMDIITGDGGFDFSFQYPQQEQVSTKLIMCQIAFAIAMQKTEGSFVLKFFDTFTRFSVDLLYLLAILYNEVYIVKPNTSRFANSEKYIVCKGFRLENTLDLVKRFYKLLLNEKMTINCLFDFELPYIFVNKVEEYNAILLWRKKKNLQKCTTWCQTHNIPYNKIIQNNNIFLSGSISSNNIHINLPTLVHTLVPTLVPLPLSNNENSCFATLS